jgi:hypothetical protein
MHQRRRIFPDSLFHWDVPGSIKLRIFFYIVRPGLIRAIHSCCPFPSDSTDNTLWLSFTIALFVS